VYQLLLVVHFIGWAIVLGAYMAGLHSPGLYAGVFHGALTALAAGTAAMVVAQTSTAVSDVHVAKMLVKIAITAVITVLAAGAKRQADRADNGTGPVKRGVKHAIGVLTLANVVIAVFA
jgi:hypothetical protein